MHSESLWSRRSASAVVFGAGLVAASISSVVGAVLVDLDAASYAGGAWTNNGTLGGTFNPTGTPTAQTVAGAPAVLFDGAGEYFEGPPSVAPIDGANPTRSIEVWAYQGNIKAEESVVSWGRRGGPEGSNMAFNYGASTGVGGFGAVGHWGAGPDLGWVGAAPAAGQWHHIVYTFTSAGNQGTTTMFVDGAMHTTETFTIAAPPTTHAGLSINLGAQRNNVAPFPIEPGLQLSGALGKVRVHDTALSLAQVQTAYAAEVGGYIGPVAQQLTALPAHRYTFDNLPSGASGTQVPDVIGGQHGTILGAAATVTATGLDLPGGASATQAYVDLPNGIISSKPSVSVEAWATIQSTQGWARVFEFGTSTVGEIAGPGGTFNGSDYIILSASNGTGADQRLERVGGTSPNPAGGATRDAIGSAVNGQMFHFAMVYDDALNEWRWYRNGVLMETVPETEGPTTIPDVNNWIGRSNWAGDANTDGLFDEFRIYDYTLTQNQIYGNFLAGPNVLNVVPEPVVGGLIGLLGVGLIFRRRR